VEWIAALAETIVAIDTAPLIYFIEANRAYTPLSQLQA
jgi:hypothetical protein